MNDAENRKLDLAQTVVDYLVTDDELLENFRRFDISKVSMDASPQSFYCGWVMSIMGTAFYQRWNLIRQHVARSFESSTQPDWAAVSAIAHEIVKDE